MTAFIEAASPHVMNTYGRVPIALARGQGCRVWDVNGKEYLDALGGIAVNTLGHNHPKLVPALQDQLTKLIHTSNYYHSPLQEALAAKLVERSGMTNVFFCNSGLEANEAAIKIARKYGVDKGIAKPEIVVYEKAFHGRSIATMSATGNPSDITTTTIARHMGVTQGALFKHFPNKEAILEAVMQWVASKLLSRIDRAITAAPTPWAALEAVFMAHVQFAVQHPGVPRMLFGELQRADNSAPKRLAQTLLREYGQRLHRLIEQAQAQGSVAADIDVQATVLLFIGSVQGLVMQALLAGDMRQMQQQAPAVYALFSRALAAPAAQSATNYKEAVRP